jgi:hypothetical protein
MTGSFFLWQFITTRVKMISNVSQGGKPKTKIPIKRSQHQPNWQLIV